MCQQSEAEPKQLKSYRNNNENNMIAGVYLSAKDSQLSPYVNRSNMSIACMCFHNCWTNAAYTTSGQLSPASTPCRSQGGQ